MNKLVLLLAALTVTACKPDMSSVEAKLEGRQFGRDEGLVAACSPVGGRGVEGGIVLPGLRDQLAGHFGRAVSAGRGRSATKTIP